MEDLNEVVLDQAADQLVQDFLLGALIATHPNPDQLRSAFEAYVSAHQVGLQDVGFDRKASPQSVMALQARIQSRVDHWRKALRRG